MTRFFRMTKKKNDAAPQEIITSMLHEERLFPAAEGIFKNAPTSNRWTSYRNDVSRVDQGPGENFGRSRAKQELVWIKPFTKTLQWKLPFAKMVHRRPAQRQRQLPGSVFEYAHGE